MRIRCVVVGMLKTNCYLLYKDNEMLVVDPGGEAEKILEEIKIIGITPKKIVNTHSHPDHVLANNAVAKATGAEILKDLEDGDYIKIGDFSLKVISAPGHAPDSVCFYGGDFLLSGDVLFEDGHGRTTFPGGSDEDMVRTLKRLKEEISEDTVVYPGHGNPFIMKNYPFNYGCGKLLKI